MIRANQKGFTLIEVLLSVAIMTILAGLSLPVYAAFQGRTDLDVTTEGVANMLRRAQTYARGMNGDSIWGVRIQSGGAVLFKGTSYVTRDASYDETVTIPTSYGLSGLTDITFAKLQATPSVTGNIVLTGLNNESRTVSLNAKGMVNY